MANYKTMQIWVKKGHCMHDYFNEMCQNAKNLHNTRKGVTKLQIEVLDSIYKQLPIINNQLSTYQKKVEKEKIKPVENRKEITCNLFDDPSKESPYVDYNFLDALFKSMVQNDYRSLPTQSSQGIMKTVFQNWKSFYASLREYKTNPSKFKARPKIPGYSRCNHRHQHRSKTCFSEGQNYQIDKSTIQSVKSSFQWYSSTR